MRATDATLRPAARLALPLECPTISNRGPVIGDRVKVCARSLRFAGHDDEPPRNGLAQGRAPGSPPSLTSKSRPKPSTRSRQVHWELAAPINVLVPSPAANPAIIESVPSLPYLISSAQRFSLSQCHRPTRASDCGVVHRYLRRRLVGPHSLTSHRVSCSAGTGPIARRSLILLRRLLAASSPSCLTIALRR